MTRENVMLRVSRSNWGDLLAPTRSVLSFWACDRLVGFVGCGFAQVITCWLDNLHRGSEFSCPRSLIVYLMRRFRIETADNGHRQRVEHPEVAFAVVVIRLPTLIWGAVW